MADERRYDDQEIAAIFEQAAHAQVLRVALDVGESRAAFSPRLDLDGLGEVPAPSAASTRGRSHT